MLTLEPGCLPGPEKSVSSPSLILVSSTPGTEAAINGEAAKIMALTKTTDNISFFIIFDSSLSNWVVV
jgi:hypothetical protein